MGNNYIRGKNGKFAGSVGNGKTHVPEPADTRPPITEAEEPTTHNERYLASLNAFRTQARPPLEPADPQAAEGAANQITHVPFFGAKKKWQEWHGTDQSPAHKWLAKKERTSGEIRDALVVLSRITPQNASLVEKYRFAAAQDGLTVLWNSDTLTTEDRTALVWSITPNMSDNDRTYGPTKHWIADPRVPGDVAAAIAEERDWQAADAYRNPNMPTR